MASCIAPLLTINVSQQTTCVCFFKYDDGDALIQCQQIDTKEYRGIGLQGALVLLQLQAAFRSLA